MHKSDSTKQHEVWVLTLNLHNSTLCQKCIFRLRAGGVSITCSDLLIEGERVSAALDTIWVLFHLYYEDAIKETNSVQLCFCATPARTLLFSKDSRCGIKMFTFDFSNCMRSEQLRNAILVILRYTCRVCSSPWLEKLCYALALAIIIMCFIPWFSKFLCTQKSI